MQAKLIIVKGSQAGWEIPISASPFLIGRTDDCHVQLENGRAGQVHCILSLHGDSPIVEDLGEEGGTMVNGRKVQLVQAIKDGDKLKVKDLELEFRRVDVQPQVDKNRKKEPEPDADDDRVLEWVGQGDDPPRARDSEPVDYETKAEAAARSKKKGRRRPLAGWDLVLLTACVLLVIALAGMLFPVEPQRPWKHFQECFAAMQSMPIWPSWVYATLATSALFVLVIVVAAFFAIRYIVQRWRDA